MPDHLHWLFVIQKSGLAEAMDRFKGSSARAINKRRGATGKLWQKSYYERAVRYEEDLKGIARYMIGNPIRAELVDSVSDYPHWDAVWL